MKEFGEKRQVENKKLRGGRRKIKQKWVEWRIRSKKAKKGDMDNEQLRERDLDRKKRGNSGNWQQKVKG